jgi:hypothetical protein
MLAQVQVQVQVLTQVLMQVLMQVLALQEVQTRLVRGKRGVPVPQRRHS